MLEYKSACKQTEREGEADRADSMSVNSLMTIISHLPFQVHKQLPIIKDCCDSLWAAVYCSSQPSVLCMRCAEKLCVAQFPAARAKHLSIHLTLPNELLGFVSFIIRRLCLALDTAGSILGMDLSFKPKLCFISVFCYRQTCVCWVSSLMHLTHTGEHVQNIQDKIRQLRQLHA